MAAKRKNESGRGTGPAAGAAQAESSALGLLLRAARLVNERALARVGSDPRAAVLRAPHAALLRHLDLEGVRPTELARQVGVTKQAIGQLVHELARLGMVERVPDPEDRRARRIRLSKRGVAALVLGTDVLHELEHDLAGAIGGRRKIDDLQRILVALIGALERDASA